MPTNVTPAYQKAEREYYESKTKEQKIKALKKMLATAPSHKGAENMRSNIKKRLARLKYTQDKEAKNSKGRAGVTVKREGAAQIVLIGKTNSGKSLFINQLTNAHLKEEAYEFTTKKPEFGVMDYHGIKVQLIEIPAVTEDFIDSEKGPAFFGVVRMADLIVLIVKGEEDLEFLKRELQEADIYFKGLIVFNSSEPVKNYYTLDFMHSDLEDIKKKMWSMLGLIYVYTKQPGKKKEFPPVALDKGDTVKDLTLKVHKDFLKRFKFARIWGPSAKFGGQEVGLAHKLQEDDVVEFHMK
ncbi:MAG: GTPase [Nanoarchaeota archaeon]